MNGGKHAAQRVALGVRSMGEEVGRAHSTESPASSEAHSQPKAQAHPPSPPSPSQPAQPTGAAAQVQSVHAVPGGKGRAAEEEVAQQEARLPGHQAHPGQVLGCGTTCRK